MTETFDQKVARVSAEAIEIVPYDPQWPARFQEEKEDLLETLPNDLIRRIEHIGSTAIPGLAAKPIVDMLIEVTDLDRVNTDVSSRANASRSRAGLSRAQAATRLDL
jgi:GrpB-like predicted nucleotidyltransferase (UPF0157 family)